MIVKVDSLDLSDNPLDGYDPVDTTSHTVLHITEPDNDKDLLTITEAEDPIVTHYKSLLTSASKITPLLKLSNPHNLTVHLPLYHQGILLKALVKAFNSALETDSRLKSLYKHIWNGSDQLEFSLEWKYCIDLVHKRMKDTYGTDMLGFVQLGQVFYEKYHMEKVKFIYTPQVGQVDFGIHRVVGTTDGTGYTSLIPGLMRDGKTILTELVCAI